MEVVGNTFMPTPKVFVISLVVEAMVNHRKQTTTNAPRSALDNARQMYWAALSSDGEPKGDVNEKTYVEIFGILTLLIFREFK